MGDSELIAEFIESGSTMALDQLLRKHLPNVRNAIYPMVMDNDIADDLAQEVFLKALRGLKNFDGHAAFSTWLYRIAMNTTYTFLARRNRSRLRFHDEPPEPVSSECDAPDNAILLAELDSSIAAALDNLSPKLRAAIVLTTLQGVPPAEAAAIEGCTTATMYWRIHEARKQLQQQLSKWLEQ